VDRDEASHGAVVHGFGAYVECLSAPEVSSAGLGREMRYSIGAVRSGPAIGLLLLACGSTPTPLVPATREAAASAEWWNGAVVYEVFVRSFLDSNGDGSGDLAGLISKLDYLNDGDPATTTDLGVDALWLMPIYPSPSYHGYDVTDYDGVNPDYGTPASMDTLISECHKRGIRVILDYVPNHTSIQHLWFSDSSRRDWYVWSTANPGWTQPWSSSATWFPSGAAWYYAVFWSGMPDLNWKTEAVRAEMGAAAGRWLARGVDGFRLDAVRYLVEDGAGLQQDRPATHADLAEWTQGVLAANPHAMVVGEAWADTPTIATYFGSTAMVPGGDGLPLLFNFPLADSVVSGVAASSALAIASTLDSVARTYAAGTADAPFLTNHDQERVASRLAGNPAKLKLAAAILLTLQGTPIIYYGEEIGMLNGSCSSDECKRTPMAWDATAHAGFTTGTPWWPHAPGAATANVASETGDGSSLLSRYRQLIRVRKGSPALSRGGTTRLSTEDANVLSYLRTAAGETVLAAHNLGSGTATHTLTAPGASADALLADPGAALVAGSGGWSVTLPPYGSGIWRLR
jgi:glycosidase